MYAHQFGRIGRGTTPSVADGDMAGFDRTSMSMSGLGAGAPPTPLGGMAPPSPPPYLGAPASAQPWNIPRPPGGQWGSQGSGGAWQQPTGLMPGGPPPTGGMMQGLGRTPGADMARRTMGAPGSPQGMKTAMGGTSGFRGALSGGVRS